MPHAKPKLSDPFCKRFDGLRETHGLRNKNMRHTNGVLALVDDALHNDSDSVREIQQEKPIHRKFVELHMQGYNCTEIAAITGHSMQWVSQILKQPFARQRMINEAKKTVSEELKELLESEIIPSMKKIIEVRDNPKSRGADVLAASEKVIERFMGKPQTNINIIEKPSSEKTDDELRLSVEKLLANSGDPPRGECTSNGHNDLPPIPNGVANDFEEFS